MRLGVLLSASALFVGVVWADTFQTGDVFASINNGTVAWYRANGTFIQNMQNGSGFTTGSASDPSGNFYVTDFSLSQVSKFDNTGAFVSTFGSGYSTPEDILFDAAGNGFAGNIGGGILKFDSAGNLLTTFDTGRTDWFDINAGQTIAYYTDEGGAIHRWDLVNDVALPDFTASGGNFALRLLSGGGLLVASFTAVNRFDAAGNIIQSYDPDNNTELFALNLDPDGHSFWTGDVNNGKLYKIDISSGNLEQTLDTGVGSQNLFGVSVFGEITQVNPPPPTAVPEPASIFLLGSVVLLGTRLRIRKKRNLN
jgi:sugar lactone lactonase YvrE